MRFACSPMMIADCESSKNSTMKKRTAPFSVAVSIGFLLCHLAFPLFALPPDQSISTGIQQFGRALIPIRPSVSTSAANNKANECPTCPDTCSLDSDCPGRFMRCCPSGCATQCSPVFLEVAGPPITGPIRQSLPIQPIKSLYTKSSVIVPVSTSQTTQQKNIPAMGGNAGTGKKYGRCPSALTLQNPRSVVACARDSECPGAEKCCDTSSGRVCALPEKTNACVHLLSAVERLPASELFNSYVPSCDANAKFNPVQCDSIHCWCVGPSSGQEILGTKLPKLQRTNLDCARPRVCFPDRCTNLNACQFGLETDEKGCPEAGCPCKNPCKGIRCENKYYECQLVEPDCAQPPCQPVPRCMLNPCPSGSPMTLPNSLVTALCTKTSQCGDGWCHQIGYNGLGFCCQAPQRSARPGVCEAEPIQRNVQCFSSECKSDPDCPQSTKCCFDGCGLKCRPIGGEDASETSSKTTSRNGQDSSSTYETSPLQRPTKPHNQPSKKASSESGRKVDIDHKKVGECLPLGGGLRSDCLSGTDECDSDDQCHGVKKCCSDGCFKRCLPPYKATNCIHLKTALEGVPSDSEGGRRVLCRIDGSFEPVQCSSGLCWCVDESGQEVQGTRTAVPRKLDCNSAPQICPTTHCANGDNGGHQQQMCVYGFEKDENGCNTCDCKNPCKGISCPDGSICSTEPVNCLDDDKCNHVPKCIPNICKSRDAILIRKDTFRPERCKQNRDCPARYHCRQFNDRGGHCCFGQEPSGQLQGARCPAVSSEQLALAFLQATTTSTCSVSKCTQDNECDSGKKCCFNGCRLDCRRPTLQQQRPSTTEEQLTEQTTVDSTTRVPLRLTPVNDDSAVQQVKVVGECLHIEPLGANVCSLLKSRASAENKNTCSADGDCLGIQKCCFDGCSAVCRFPDITTECLHAKIAAQSMAKIDPSNSLFEPACTVEGRFERLQRQNGMAWCVDARGNEIGGTRSLSAMAPNCDRNVVPRPCPLLQPCDTKCPFGFESDPVTGCPHCICQNPCHGITCPRGTVCRMTAIECLKNKREDCNPVPKCVLNACPHGDPLDDPTTKLLSVCDDQKNAPCGPGFFCHKFGMNGKGYCCPGIVLQSELVVSALQCPSIPILQVGGGTKPPSLEPNLLRCRITKDCSLSKDEMCCFDGVGTSCLPLTSSSRPPTKKSDSAVESFLETIDPERGIMLTQVSTKDGSGSSSTNLLFQCPANNASNPGCASNCVNDLNCHVRSQFLRCCPFGCGRTCQFGEELTTCVHWLASNLIEVDKIGLQATGSLGRPTVLCSREGLFEEIQCDVLARKCWCVEKSSGIEVPGTRMLYSRLEEIGAENRRPNCREPRVCRMHCPQSDCEHGIKLDASGCSPAQCECRNPCDEFKCSRPSEICVLRRVKCLLKKPCPSIPTCIEDACAKIGLNLFTKDGNKKPLVCGSPDDCDQGLGATECRETGSGVGICCTKGLIPGGYFVHTALGSKQGACPLVYAKSGHKSCKSGCEVDGECPGAQKCCQLENGCKNCTSPLPPTNCINMLAAIQFLDIEHIPHRLNRPFCDHKTGSYGSTQCDNYGNCWCVDETTGSPILGTRKFQSLEPICGKDPVDCPIHCDQNSCPFGIETDETGCPRTSECQCVSPCDSINCPNNQICVLRPGDCRDEHCLPVPRCEISPCVGQQVPRIELKTRMNIPCREHGPEQCPTDSYCSIPNSKDIGVCCPGKDSIMKTATVELVGCDRLANVDLLGAAMKHHCTMGRDSDCPNYHHCTDDGTCCPNRRLVCNVGMSQGNCSRTAVRFFYDSETNSCRQFIYSGCGGTLNNFISAADCEQFCMSVHNHEKTAANNDDHLMDLYSVGFVLTGPLQRDKHSQKFTTVLRDYVTHSFGIKEGELRDMVVRDDNTVRFSIVSPDAREKAENISEAVTSGRFQLDHDGSSYKAEPHTWFSQQTALQAPDVAEVGGIFWLIFISSVIFALIVLLLLCCGCTIIQKQAVSESGESSIYNGPPSPHSRQQQTATYMRARSIPTAAGYDEPPYDSRVDGVVPAPAATSSHHHHYLSTAVATSQSSQPAAATTQQTTTTTVLRRQQQQNQHRLLTVVSSSNNRRIQDSSSSSSYLETTGQHAGAGLTPPSFATAGNGGGQKNNSRNEQQISHPQITKLYC